jgi:hypothetical protein
MRSVRLGVCVLLCNGISAKSDIPHPTAPAKVILFLTYGNKSALPIPSLWAGQKAVEFEADQPVFCKTRLGHMVIINGKKYDAFEIHRKCRLRKIRYNVLNKLAALQLKIPISP